MTEDRQTNEEVDENDNYFSKHFKPSKREGCNVRFNLKENVVNLITIQSDSMETMEQQKEHIEALETYEQIDSQIDSLLDKLEELALRKIKGFDVSYDFDLVKYQVKALRRQKEKIEKREEEMENVKKEMEKIEQEQKKYEFKPEKEKQMQVVLSKRKNQISVKEGEKYKNDLFKEEIFEYLEHSTSSKNIDIFFLFHDQELPKNELKHLIEKLELHSAIRFSFGFYNYSENSIKIIDFKKKETQKNLISVMNVREEILNLDWHRDSISLVLNLTGVLDKKYDENLKNFVNHEDQFKQLLDYREIFFVINSRKTPVWNITTQSFLSEITLKARSTRINRRLAFLKRYNFITSSQVIEALNRKKFSSIYDELIVELKNFEKSKILSFEKSSFSSPIVPKKSFDSEIKVIGEPIINSHGLKILKCERKKYFRNDFFWLEILDSQENLNQILKIHLTAFLIVERFNRDKEYLFKIPKMVQIEFKNFIIGALEINLDMNMFKIGFPECQDMIDCLTHFSYELSEKQFILKDMRPLIVDGKRLLTEPVIFSRNSDYGPSDLGIKGILKFVDEHECNQFCHQYKLYKLN